MQALTTLFPVFMMIALGCFCRIKGIVSVSQKDGANHIIFNILFPILIFNIILTAKLQASAILIVAYVLLGFIISMIIGRIIFKGKLDFAHYMLTTCEGGNVALPLYTSIVGIAYASNTVVYDLAGTIMAFIIIPILVMKQGSSNTSTKELIKTICQNSFVQAVFLGLVLNLLGAYSYLSTTQFIDVYTSTINTLTQPIVGMILFIIGYNLKINLDTLGSILKLLVLRIVLYVGIILGFFVFFKDLMADPIYRIGVFIYFMCPTGFAMPMLISPILKDGDDDFLSAFISLGMVITLVVYTIIVLFIA